MTNQNDTQDEAERLANEYANDLYAEGKSVSIADFNAFKEGYRAGVASKEPEIASLKHDLATKSSTDLISEKYRLREQLAESRAEVERLKKALYSTEESSAEQYQRAQIHKEQLAAEKQKALKLVEALEIYANRVCEFTDGGGGRVFYKNGSDNPPALPFYSGEQWELGHHAEKALSEYNASTDSGDGETK